jgi:hypothetical protein
VILHPCQLPSAFEFPVRLPGRSSVLDIHTKQTPLRLEIASMESECYDYNGVQYNNSRIKIPCNTTAIENGKHSACCAPDDLCLTNGMCRNQGDDQIGKNYYWREGCTDATFEDSACPQYCNYSEGQNLHLGVLLPK